MSLDPVNWKSVTVALGIIVSPLIIIEGTKWAYKVLFKGSNGHAKNEGNHTL